MKALQLLGVSLTVGNLESSVVFYEGALAFERCGPAKEMNNCHGLYASDQAQHIFLKRGQQILEIIQFKEHVAPYPGERSSNNPWFQHCALATDDIQKSYARLRQFSFLPVSPNGPSSLPGGIIAFKFRDPEGHPFELIQFPDQPPETTSGIDHSAIVVSNAGVSVAFYEQVLGLEIGGQQTNVGPAQDALDGLAHTSVAVIGLKPHRPAPHLELLCYSSPVTSEVFGPRALGLATSRLVFWVDAIDPLMKPSELGCNIRGCALKDPDGHDIILLEAPGELDWLKICQSLDTNIPYQGA